MRGDNKLLYVIIRYCSYTSGDQLSCATLCKRVGHRAVSRVAIIISTLKLADHSQRCVFNSAQYVMCVHIVFGIIKNTMPDLPLLAEANVERQQHGPYAHSNQPVWL